jgi:hypothetical protein
MNAARRESVPALLGVVAEGDVKGRAATVVHVSHGDLKNSLLSRLPVLTTSAQRCSACASSPGPCIPRNNLMGPHSRVREKNWRLQRQIPETSYCLSLFFFFFFFFFPATCIPHHTKKKKKKKKKKKRQTCRHSGWRAACCSRRRWTAAPAVLATDSPRGRTHQAIYPCPCPLANHFRYKSLTQPAAITPSCWAK